MCNKMKYYVIFDNGNYNVKSIELLTENDKENIIHGPCTAPTACLKADELEEEYINKNGKIDTRHYFENAKYYSTIVKPVNKCND